MSSITNVVVEDEEQANRDNQERQRNEQLMSDTLHKMNVDQIMTADDIDHVSKSGIVTLAKPPPSSDSIATPDSQKTEPITPDETKNSSSPCQDSSKVIADTLQKTNVDEILTTEDTDHMSKSVLPHSIRSFTTTTDTQQTEPAMPDKSKSYQDSSKVFETFGKQYWD